MGNTPCSERYTRGSSTGVLTLSNARLHSWSTLIHELDVLDNLHNKNKNSSSSSSKYGNSNVVIRTLSLSDNTLRRSIPCTLMQLSLWRTLRSLDLSKNGLRCACALGIVSSQSRRHSSKAHCLHAVQTQSSSADTAPHSFLIRVASRSRESVVGHNEGNSQSEIHPTRSGVASNNARNGVSSATLDCGPLQQSTPAGMCYPLESLNLSYNDLITLPPGLCVRFPRLRRLVCTHNTQALQQPVAESHTHAQHQRREKHSPASRPNSIVGCGGLMNCIGNGAQLELIDLSHSHITCFCLVRLETSSTSGATAWQGTMNSAVSSTGTAARTVFPALRELRLDANELAGTFYLCAGCDSDGGGWHANEKDACTVEAIKDDYSGQRYRERVAFPSLRIVSLSQQQQHSAGAHARGGKGNAKVSYPSPGTLCALDPDIFDVDVCPQLTSMNLSGNEREEEIRDQLAKSDVYRNWRERNATQINKQLASGLTVTMM